MLSKHTSLAFLLDLLIPVGAVLVICFALGSLFYDGHVRFSSNRSHDAALVGHICATGSAGAGFCRVCCHDDSF